MEEELDAAGFCLEKSKNKRKKKFKISMKKLKIVWTLEKRK